MHLVLGASGYTGRHVADALRQAVTVRTAEVGDDLAPALDGVEVVHLCADRHPGDRRAAGQVPPSDLGRVGTALRAAGVRRVVLISTAAVYGPQHPARIGALTVPRPRHRCERAWLADEGWVRRLDGPEVVVLRPAQGFGPGEPVGLEIARAILAGGVRLPNGGRGRRGFLHGGDLGRAALAAAERGRPGATYLISGFESSWREFAFALADALEVPGRVSSTPYELAWIAAAGRQLSTPGGERCWPDLYAVDLLARSQRYDDAGARRELTWSPQVGSFAEAAAEVADWVRAVVPAPIGSRTPPGR